MSEMRKVTFLTAVLCGIFVACICADVKLPSVISDGMVLQQKASVSLWGWAAPGEKIKVKPSWKWLSSSTVADEEGNWKIDIRTPKAGGPYNISIKGQNHITLRNILI